jgi:hypothetical protein
MGFVLFVALNCIDTVAICERIELYHPSINMHGV